jgi:hypothetical protein
MVKALQRVGQLAALSAGRVEVGDIPANRLQVLARTGLGSKASALARLGDPKRTGTLVAVLCHLEATAVDDTLDLFALLMATRLFSPARRASAEQRLAVLPRLLTCPASGSSSPRSGWPAAAPDSFRRRSPAPRSLPPCPTCLPRSTWCWPTSVWLIPAGRFPGLIITATAGRYVGRVR